MFSGNELTGDLSNRRPEEQEQRIGSSSGKPSLGRGLGALLGKTTSALSPGSKPNGPSEELVVIRDKHNPDDWVRAINKQLEQAFILYGKSAEKLIASGRTLKQAKKDLGFGYFGKMFGPGKLRIDQDTAEKLISIVENQVLTNSDNYRNLPPALTTLHRLSKIEPASLQTAMDRGRISPMMSTREATVLAAELEGKTHTEPEKNLEYHCKTLGGYLQRKISAIEDQELRDDVIADLIKKLEQLAEEEPRPKG